MILIIILVVSLIEYFLPMVANIRQFAWFLHYYAYLEKRLSSRPLWAGPIGLACVLVPPLLLFVLIYRLIVQQIWIGDFFISIVVLLFCVGPGNLFQQLEQYLQAVKQGDTVAAEDKAALIYGDAQPEDESRLLDAMLIQFNQCNFAVLFWFILLGPFGALLYRLVCLLQQRHSDIRSGLADSLHDLHALLNWAPARLLCFGFALAGNLKQVLEEWRKIDNGSIYRNELLIRSIGRAAIYLGQEAGHADWVDEICGLLRRTFVLWLAVLAIIVLLS